jgi:hypothetical protein
VSRAASSERRPLTSSESTLHGPPPAAEKYSHTNA